MNNPARPTAKIATPRFRAAKATDRGLEKKCLSFFPRIPLKSLDSDEEIQGNPIRSLKGFRGETARRQGNPKRSTEQGRAQSALPFEAWTWSKAWAMSAVRSSTFSSPTDRRNKLSLMP